MQRNNATEPDRHLELKRRRRRHPPVDAEDHRQGGAVARASATGEQPDLHEGVGSVHSARDRPGRRLARDDTVILTQNDSNDRKITV